MSEVKILFNWRTNLKNTLDINNVIIEISVWLEAIPIILSDFNHVLERIENEREQFENKYWANKHLS